MGQLGDMFAPVDCLSVYARCRQELGQLGVPDQDAIAFCAFSHWGYTVRNAELFGI